MKRIKVKIIPLFIVTILIVSGCMPSVYTRGVDYSDYPDRKLPIYEDAVVYDFDGDDKECEIEYGTDVEIKDIEEFYKEEFEDDDYTILDISEDDEDEFFAEGYIDDIYFVIEAKEASGEPKDYFATIVKIKTEEYDPDEIKTEENNSTEIVEDRLEPEERDKNLEGEDIKLYGESKIADFDWDSISDDIIAAFDRGMEYYDEGKYKRAVEEFKLCAEGGHPTAQGMLGDCYYYGAGVEPDRDKAIYWYERGALQGDELSQYSLGYIYCYGKGLDRDAEKGIYLIESAGNQGYLYAQDFLGWCYGT